MKSQVTIPREAVGNKITIWLEHPGYPDRFFCVGAFWNWDKAPTVSIDRLDYYENQSNVVLINLEETEHDEAS